VTVVFSDLSGSTALGERLDPESLSQVMTRYYEAMRAVVRHHGGTVEKFAGDAVMAVFGIPDAHEDDALRAVRAASGMHDALGELNDRLEREWGVRLVTIARGVGMLSRMAWDDLGLQLRLQEETRTRLDGHVRSILTEARGGPDGEQPVDPELVLLLTEALDQAFRGPE
jgi:Adenylate and Guanylate cyclase catalytic domain